MLGPRWSRPVFCPQEDGALFSEITNVPGPYTNGRISAFRFDFGRRSAAEVRSNACSTVFTRRVGVGAAVISVLLVSCCSGATDVSRT